MNGRGVYKKQSGNTSTPGLIIARLKSEHSKWELLRAAGRRSREAAKSSGVYVNPHFTPIQQESQPALRAELRVRIQKGEKVGIRGGRIVFLHD